MNTCPEGCRISTATQSLRLVPHLSRITLVTEWGWKGGRGGTAVTMSGHTLVRGVFEESSSLLSQLKLFVSLVCHIPRTSQARATAGWSQGIVRSQVIHSISYDGHFPPPLVLMGRILRVLSLGAPSRSSFARSLDRDRCSLPLLRVWLKHARSQQPLPCQLDLPGRLAGLEPSL